MFTPLVLLLLAGVGLLAGFVDAIAGGGGLVSLPVLLSVGLPPVGALATNKAQGAVGTVIAAATYWRKGLVELRPLLPAVVATFAGSLTGAFVVQRLDTTRLAVAVPIALLCIAAYFLFAPRLTDADRHARLNYARFVPVMGLCIGFYDGVFGPGTGSFMTMGFVVLFGLGVTRAAAHTKVLNLTSNLAALALFIPSGNVVWPVAIVMMAGQVAGGYLGALTGIRFGARLIRPLVVIVSMILALRLLITGHS
ncbi:MAG: TSUP family transporter [Devosia sp.]|nr:TSUP family transporter [Devosia sp.]